MQRPPRGRQDDDDYDDEEEEYYEEGAGESEEFGDDGNGTGRAKLPVKRCVSM